MPDFNVLKFQHTKGRFAWSVVKLNQYSKAFFLKVLKRFICNKTRPIVVQFITNDGDLLQLELLSEIAKDDHEKIQVIVFIC